MKDNSTKEQATPINNYDIDLGYFLPASDRASGLPHRVSETMSRFAELYDLKEDLGK